MLTTYHSSPSPCRFLLPSVSRRHSDPSPAMCLGFLLSTSFHRHSEADQVASYEAYSFTPTITTTPPTPRPLLLLDLPAELRIAIYEASLLGPRPALALLYICHQIAMEALSTLYQRHITFGSQAELFAFIERSRSSNLSRVRTLSLRFTDINLSAVWEDKRQTRSSVWTLYQEELTRLDGALVALPSMTELTISPPTGSRSHLLRGLYLSFLALIPIRYPKLQHLYIDEAEAVLDKVPGLRELASVSLSIPAITEQNTTRRRRESVVGFGKAEAEHTTVGVPDRRTRKRQMRIRRRSCV